MSNMLTLFISCLQHAKQGAVTGVAFLDRVGLGVGVGSRFLSGCHHFLNLQFRTGALAASLKP